ncbi:MAG: hypothetical protein N4A38_04865 [Candidatus Gracilibacteria bacterium]|nr:hypothetical protein [Candidatus Gracilibacteria bacterium]
MDFFIDILKDWENFSFLGLSGIPAIIVMVLAVTTGLSFVLGFVGRAIQLALIVIVLTALSNTGFFEMIMKFMSGAITPA